MLFLSLREKHNKYLGKQSAEELMMDEASEQFKLLYN
jgi:hypothetical protein